MRYINLRLTYLLTYLLTTYLLTCTSSTFCWYHMSCTNLTKHAASSMLSRAKNANISPSVLNNRQSGRQQRAWMKLITFNFTSPPELYLTNDESNNNEFQSQAINRLQQKQNRPLQQHRNAASLSHCPEVYRQFETEISSATVKRNNWLQRKVYTLHNKS